MRMIPPEEDLRTITDKEWEEIRMLHEMLRTGEFDEEVVIGSTAYLGDVICKMMRECRRLRTLAQFSYLAGYNQGMEARFQTDSDYQWT